MPVLFKISVDNRKKLNKERNIENFNYGKFYARAITIGTIDTNGIADIIQKNCSMKRSDVMAVLAELSEVMTQKLQDSYAVKLNGIGTFRIGIHTVGADTLEKFSVSNNVVNKHVNFMPEYTVDSATGKRTVALVNGARFQETVVNTMIRTKEEE